MSPLKIIFAGTPEFAAKSLSALLQTQHTIVAVYTQPDRPAGRGQKLTASPVKDIALRHQLPIFQPQTLRDEAEQMTLKNLAADVMIVAAYGLILPEAVLIAPHLGCINIHASLLPRWRGAAPIQRAILAGDATTGITIMQMDAGLDTGAMLYKVSCPILATDTSATLHDKLANIGSEAIVTALDLLTQGKIKPEIQDVSQATYAQKIQKEEAKLDWQLPAIELQRKIRGFNPWPVAYTQCKENIVRIWEADVIPSSHDNQIPGSVIHADANGIQIKTGKDILNIQKLQFPGGRVLSAIDVLNARRDEFSVGSQVFS